MWFRVFLQALVYPIRVMIIGTVYLYKTCISPLLPKTCRFYPTCSTYMVLAIAEWGIFKGVWLGLKRIIRCRPNGESGCDFVPINLKGDLKWIY